MRCWRASSLGPPPTPAAPRTDAADDGRDPYGEQGVCGVLGDCAEAENVDAAYEDAYDDRDDRAWHMYGEGDGSGYAAEHDGDGAWKPRPVADVVPRTDTDVLSGGSAPAPDVSAMLVSGRRNGGSVRLSGRGRSLQAGVVVAVTGGSLTTSSSSSRIRAGCSGSSSAGRELL